MTARPNLNRMYAALAGADDTPTLNLQSFRRLDADRYSLVLSGVPTSRKYSFAQFAEAIAKITDGAASLVEGSLTPIHTAHLPMFRAIASVNVESKTFNDENAKGMVAVTANVFRAPEDDKLWRIVGTGDAKRMVQMTRDNYDEIFEARRVRNPVVASYAQTVPYADGDYVYFLNTASNQMDFGFVIKREDRDVVLSRASGQLVSILPESVVEAADIGEPIPVVAADGTTQHKSPPKAFRMQTMAAQSFALNAYLDYMRTLYGGTEYFKAMEKAIRATTVG